MIICEDGSYDAIVEAMDKYEAKFDEPFPFYQYKKIATNQEGLIDWKHGNDLIKIISDSIGKNKKIKAKKKYKEMFF